jgi:hypothetical protein
MKRNMNILKYTINRRLVLLFISILTLASCKKALDQEPVSNITPEKYLQEESQLGAYAIARYTGILPSHGNYSFGTFGIDGNTDNGNPSSGREVYSRVVEGWCYRGRLGFQ